MEGSVVANEKSVGLFLNLSQVQNIEGLEYLDTSHVSDMSYMFSGMKNLRNLNVSNFNTSQVTNMFAIFSSTSKLTSLDISTFNTSNITNMGSIFSDMSSLIELKLSGIDTQNVINFTNMFSGASSLSSLDLSDFNTSSAINMSSMFDGAKSLISLDISSFDPKSVTNMNSMFNSVESLTTLNVSSFNTSAVTSMNSMFANMKSLIEIDTTYFDTSKVGNMSYMFNGMKNLTYLNLSYIDNQNEYTQLFGFLEGTNKLQQLVLGPNLQLYSSVNLPEIFADDQFTGYWRNVGSGTLDCPQGTNILTSTELQNKYDGNSMADTYVWQKTKLSISANDSIIYVGDVWNPEDNFDSALDKDGTTVNFKDIEIDQNDLDTSKEGVYEVTYSFGGVTNTAKITVVNDNKDEIKNSENNNNNKSSNDSKGGMNKSDEQKNIDKNQIDENKTQDNLPVTASVETAVWEYLIGGLVIISALILYYLKKAKY
ncbi:BspA family leucine-rich repeat surface protein [Lactococcus lactis]|nr:BspA family leucine-rich repeat surface protein [Lactococcus lactis]